LVRSDERPMPPHMVEGRCVKRHVALLIGKWAGTARRLRQIDRRIQGRSILIWRSWSASPRGRALASIHDSTDEFTDPCSKGRLKRMGSHFERTRLPVLGVIVVRGQSE
jgi:hypothetical protein